MLLDGQTGAFTRWNAARADQRFAPCSTFKIPNTAILLETGAATDPEFVVKYDPALKASREAWRKDHTLRSAYRDSVLWYYHALSKKAGLPAEARLVKQFGYGNADTSGGVAGERPFWIDGSLRISPNEQVAFLKRLHENRLGLSERTTRLTKEIMIAEQTPRGHPAGQDRRLPSGRRRRGHALVRRLRREAGRRLVLRARARRQGLRSADGAARPQGARDPRRPRASFRRRRRRHADDRRPARSALAHVRRRWKTLVEACASARSQDALLHPSNLPPEFFDLSTGIAGEYLQKWRNYRVRVAVLCPPGSRRGQLAVPRDGRRGVAQRLLPHLRDARAGGRVARGDRRRGRRRLGAERRHPWLPGSVTG